jgi:hypothetical protein
VHPSRARRPGPARRSCVLPERGREWERTDGSGGERRFMREVRVGRWEGRGGWGGRGRGKGREAENQRVRAMVRESVTRSCLFLNLSNPPVLRNPALYSNISLSLFLSFLYFHPLHYVLPSFIHSSPPPPPPPLPPFRFLAEIVLRSVSPARGVGLGLLDSPGVASHPECVCNRSGV